MGSWIESWLAGSKPQVAAEPEKPDQPHRPYRGADLGLPERGAGAIASMGRRLGAFVLDCVVAALITSLFTHPHPGTPSMQAQNHWSLVVWFLIGVVGTGFFGFTPGMALFGVRVVRIDGARMVGLLRAVPRTLLVGVVIPAVVWDANNRGLQDRVAGTIVVALR